MRLSQNKDKRRILLILFSIILLIVLQACSSSNSNNNNSQNENQTWYKDADEDGYSDGTTRTSATRPDERYYLASELKATSGDTDDSDPSVYPGAVPLKTWYKDADEDGYSDGTTRTSATRPDERYYLASELTNIFLEDLDDYEDIINPAITLSTLRDKSNIEWGTAVMPNGLEDVFYKKMIGQQFDLVIPDYGMYMTEIQRNRGDWDFSDMDDIVNFAKIYNMRLRGHALIYGRPIDSSHPNNWYPTPDWLRNGNFSRTEMINIMYEHIEKVMNRYSDDIGEWVVVNEAVSGKRYSEMSENIWLKGIGEDYVELAFKHAREVAPHAVLILNETQGDYIGQRISGVYKVNQIYNFVSKLLQKGTPIDAIGLQFHLVLGDDDEDITTKDEPSVRSIVNNFARYKDLGLDVYITELDIRIKKPITQQKLEKQAQIYSIITEAVLKSDACNSISIWGYTDKYSWITTFGERFEEYTAACLFDGDINTPEINPKPKPAFASVIKTIQNWDGKIINENWLEEINLYASDLEFYSKSNSSMWEPSEGSLILSNEDKEERWYCILKKDFSFKADKIYRFHINGTGPKESLVYALFATSDGETQYADSKFYWENGFADLESWFTGAAEFRLYFGDAPAGVYHFGQ